MHVIHPARYERSISTHRNRHPFFFLVLVLAIIVTINYFRPLPNPTVVLSVTTPTTNVTPQLVWPVQGQAAVAASNYGLLDTTDNQTPLATASIAKVITALCILQKEPLKNGESGPTFTIGVADTAIYQNYVNQNGSVMFVQQGEKLTEYQALEALMLPSANNIADSLSQWVFGSQKNYAAYATSYLEQHGLNQTHIGTDASGFDPSTTSTASDLTNLGLLALKNSVLMQIAGQRTAILPVVGTVSNYDTVLGHDGITGLKTGNNDADPGAFLFTASKRLGNKDVTVTGTVMGASDLDSALNAAENLSNSLLNGFEDVTIATAGQQVGMVRTVWGSQAAIVTNDTLQIIRWKATPITEHHQLHVSLAAKNIGSIKIVAGKAQSQTSLRVRHTLRPPSFWWRLTRH